MKCPVCGDLAEDITARRFGGRTICCRGECGEFEISEAALAKFPQLSPEQRHEALSRAQRERDPDNPPLISDV